jgi:hypothetical protein
MASILCFDGKTHLSYCLTLLFSAILIMLLSLWVSFDETSTSHSKVVYEETLEWSMSPIIDLTSVDDDECPEGYETLIGKFYGTRDVCMNTWTNGFTLGKCRNNDENTRRGLGSRPLELFDSRSICYRRGILNYHVFANQRSLVTE